MKLTRCDDYREVDLLTRDILDDLGKKAQEFEAEDRKGVFIYRLVLGHVFSWLKERGEGERIKFLQDILLIHPSHYLDGSE
jgi:hypothetical protein